LPPDIFSSDTPPAVASPSEQGRYSKPISKDDEKGVSSPGGNTDPVACN